MAIRRILQLYGSTAVKEILPNAPISSVIIKRTMEEIIVDINTSRPGVVIGKKGEEIEKIKRRKPQTTKIHGLSTLVLCQNNE